ncbi:unnamed protein product [Sympodiomycopsis kandeliae]
MNTQSQENTKVLSDKTDQWEKPDVVELEEYTFFKFRAKATAAKAGKDAAEIRNPGCRGGDYTFDNVAPSCAGCNFGKDRLSVTDAIQFFKYLKDAEFEVDDRGFLNPWTHRRGLDQFGHRIMAV